MESILGPLFPLTFIVLLAAERVVARRSFAGRWTAKGVFFFLVGAVINGVVPPLLTGLVSSPVDLGALGLVGGTVVAFLATSLADYLLHRLYHRFDFLWRWAHQMHHSAERVDVVGFAYSHPVELVLSVLLATVVGLAIGVTADAVLLAGYLFFVTQIFLHMDIRTPAWVGLLVQRPEAHRLHHSRGVHAYNYGLPLWDAVFGTRRNPDAWDAEYGFWDGASAKVGAMLLGRDVGEGR